MKYNNELKRIDSQEKAYLLGFLYGDGTITTYKEKTGRIRYLTKISVNIIDKDLIYQLREYFPFFNVGNFDYSKYNENSKKQIYLSKSSKELYEDLLSNGIYPRKSYENANELRLPNIKSELIRHFIRGFFDADGSVYRRAKRRNLIVIEFSCVAKEFIYEINSYLKTHDMKSWKIIVKPPKGKGKQTYYNLSFIKTSEILKLIKFMYNDSTISLKRKAEKCLNYKPVNKVLDRNMCCSTCNSPNILKNGERNNSIRFKCKDCGKGFSIKKTIK